MSIAHFVVDVQAEGGARMERRSGLRGGIHIARLAAHHDARLVVDARLQAAVPADSAKVFLMKDATGQAHV